MDNADGNKKSKPRSSKRNRGGRLRHQRPKVSARLKENPEKASGAELYAGLATGLTTEPIAYSPKVTIKRRKRTSELNHQSINLENSLTLEKPHAIVEATNQQLTTAPAQQNWAPRTSTTTLSAITEHLFQDLRVHTTLLKAVSEQFGYENMTLVQSKSIPVALNGGDVLVRARTGTGKTLSFLIPSIHRTMSYASSREHISVLVVSPTRELAHQIAKEATILLSGIPEAHAQTVVGGTKVQKDIHTLKRKVPLVLIGTPGRLNDHLGNPKSGFAHALSGLKIFILDECDQLLDRGFRPELERIMSKLPSLNERQTLLFSATMPSVIEDIAKIALKEKYDVVDCVGDQNSTHEYVPQFFLVSSLKDQASALGLLLMEAMRVAEYKIIVFFSTAGQTQYFSQLFEKMGRPVLEMHSRKTQGYRNKTSDNFRDAKNVIMFTSDVSARGLDYPDITAVIQVGIPQDKNTYVHRLGRTARAGKKGKGVLLLSDFESSFALSTLNDIPLQPHDPLREDVIAQLRAMYSSASKSLPSSTKSSVYQAWLGYYNGFARRLKWSKQELVQRANHWITDVVGEKEPPKIQASTIAKMNLAGIPGLRIASYSHSRRGGRGRKRGGYEERAGISRPKAHPRPSPP